MNIFKNVFRSSSTNGKLSKAQQALDDTACLTESNDDPINMEPTLVHQRTSESVKDTEEPTLLAKLGGEAALELVVDNFYDRLVADPALERFFKGQDMKRLRNHQNRFLKIAFTGIPEGMDVEKMIFRAHKRLFEREGLNATHFDLVAGHLVGTLRDFSIRAELINDVLAIVGPLRPVFDVLSTDC